MNPPARIALEPIAAQASATVDIAHTLLAAAVPMTNEVSGLFGRLDAMDGELAMARQLGPPGDEALTIIAMALGRLAASIDNAGATA
ncbi:MAG: hypothetical protein KKB74_14750 [Bacteroidetes bacterium]|nr:hypothetical protein [Rhizobiaceae bacterium]MBU3929060.1 hypothetical protein [Bacteroidota bacterium]MBU4040823.1 hypothetical protein [Alphaproteobacteria bacterium]MBU4137821.1 hypothetical protein [Alphaproteobacteria bacterium]